MQAYNVHGQVEYKVGGPASSSKELTDRRVEQPNWIVAVSIKQQAAQTSDGSL
jgi:hypothetical protein